MVTLGYALSSEEHPPNELVHYAASAEEAGFGFAMISGHFHPWTRRQGHSPFVWSVLGGISAATQNIPVGTAVTCPTMRIHPAIVAQAAATAAAMMPGRFMLGVGTGENLNEHILGAKWQPPKIRLEMLEEAIGVLRLLWQGGSASHYGKYYTVENAQIFTLPQQLPAILVAATGTGAARLAGHLGDGLIATAPEKKLIKAFEEAGGIGKPRYGQITVCWAPTEEEGMRCAREIWPNAMLNGEAKSELPLPRHFEQLTEDATEKDIVDLGQVICGADPDQHLDAIRKFEDAGFDHVYIHQVGPDQQDFIRFYREEIMPEFVEQDMPAPVRRHEGESCLSR